MKQKGFTLIELLVIIAIIGLLTTGAIALLENARSKARDSKTRADLIQLAKAIQLYVSDNDAYPPIDDSGQGPLSGALTSDLDSVAWQSFVNNYMQLKPSPVKEGEILSSSGHTNSPFKINRYLYVEPGASATGGATQHALNPLATPVLVAPIENPQGTPPDCDGIISNPNWSGGPSQSTNCQDLNVGCRITGSQLGAGTTWICIRL